MGHYNFLKINKKTENLNLKQDRVEYIFPQNVIV